MTPVGSHLKSFPQIPPSNQTHPKVIRQIETHTKHQITENLTSGRLGKLLNLILTAPAESNNNMQWKQKKKKNTCLKTFDFQEDV